MSWRRRPGIWMPMLVGVVNLIIRLPRLSKPPSFVFDEIYYAQDANDLLRWGIEQGVPSHPPLGKWLIAGGIRIFGFTPFGFRIAAVLAGALICAIVASTAYRLTHRVELGALAGMLVGLDGIMFVTSRVAMLDIFAALFVVIVVWCAVSAWECRPNLSASRLYGLGAAIALGLGSGVKWNVGYLIPACLITWGIIELRDGPGTAARRTGRFILMGVAFAVIPLGAYVETYVPTFLTNSQHLSPITFIGNQQDLIKYHQNLEPKNVYARPAKNWPLMTYPAELYKQTCFPAEGATSLVCPKRDVSTQIRIIATPNPVVWFGAMAAGLVLLACVIWRRDVRALLLLLFALLQFVPWLFTRPPYSFYEATLVPLMVLWIPLALVRLRPLAHRIVGGTGLLASAGFFVFLYPIFAAVPMTAAEWSQRMLLGTWR